MANICLPPVQIPKIRQALVSGKLSPDKLSVMTSAERRKLLSSIVGEGDAHTINSLFESKLLLKNKQQGYLTWAKSLANVKPDIKRDLISRIQRMDERILDPATEKQFLSDLAETKLGVNVTSAEAKKIANMSTKLQELEAKRKPDGTFKSEAERMAYGRTKVDMGQYLADLKNNANKVALKDLPKQTVLHPIEAASKAGGFAKSIKAAFDDSALLRQNWKTLLSHPGIWMKNAQKNIGDLYKQGIKNEDVIREVKADVFSRPNADKYTKMGLAIGKMEEEFGDPAIIMKTPGVGRLYKTTEAAFTGLMYRTRADLADHYLDLAKKAGVNINDPKELKAIGSMINSLTGRANVGRLEGGAAQTLNNVFFSPRFIKSQVDTLTHVATGAGGSNFVRKEAAKNLMKIVGLTAGVFATANAIRPGSVELDPRSSKFGKITVGDTTFDLTGGFGPIGVLAARLYTQQYKSNRGIVSGLGSNPLIPKGGDLVQQFITGKLSPAAQRAWVNLVTKEEYNGAKPSLGSNASNLLTPLPINTYSEAKGDPHAANPLITEAADALGISANTTNPNQRVKQNPSKADQDLRNKLGQQKFNEYNKQYNSKLTSFTEGNFYRSLPQDKKQDALSEAERSIKKSLYKQYNYKAPKSTKPDKSFNNSVDAQIH